MERIESMLNINDTLGLNSYSCNGQILDIVSLQSRNIKDLTDEEILYIVKNTCNKTEGIKSQAYIIDKAFCMTKKGESFWEGLNSFFIELKGNMILLQMFI